MASTTTSGPAPNHIAYDLLRRAHSPDTANQIFTENVKQKPLFLRPTSPTPADKRSRRRLHRLRKKEYYLRKQKPKPLSAREKRASGIYDIPKEERRYAIFVGLHRMWVEYMQEVLGLKSGRDSGGAQKNKGGKQVAGASAGALVTAQSHGVKLAGADFHGAEIEVVRSRCVERVGVKGVVVRDSKFTFVVVTPKDELKTIPKEHTVFRFEIPLPNQNEDERMTGDEEGPSESKTKENLVFELHGSQFESRPVDRANKKFKWRNIDYL